MVMLYVGGHYVGRLSDDPDALARFARTGQRVELRDEDGNQLGKFIPTNEPLVPWDPSITQEDLDRILAGPFFTYDEIRKRMGWE